MEALAAFMAAIDPSLHDKVKPLIASFEDKVVQVRARLYIDIDLCLDLRR